MTKNADGNTQNQPQGAVTTAPAEYPTCGSGTDALMSPAQSPNIELSFDYLRTADVTRLSTSVKLKFAPRATLPDMLWEAAWKLIRSHLLGKWLK